MGLLSKLFDGNKDMEKAAKDLLSGLFNAAEQNAEKKAAAPEPKAERFEEDEDGPSGFSWGPKMPAEENQFNYNGTFTEYFENIFRSDLADLTFQKEEKARNRQVVYTFFSGGSKAVVVELLSSKSSVYKLREDCRKEGTPYLRFYIDHEGWWNTRAYVAQRIRGAIK